MEPQARPGLTGGLLSRTKIMIHEREKTGWRVLGWGLLEFSWTVLQFYGDYLRWVALHRLVGQLPLMLTRLPECNYNQLLGYTTSLLVLFHLGILQAMNSRGLFAVSNLQEVPLLFFSLSCLARPSVVLQMVQLIVVLSRRTMNLPIPKAQFCRVHRYRCQ